jgi:hypothetical protein
MSKPLTSVHEQIFPRVHKKLRKTESSCEFLLLCPFLRHLQSFNEVFFATFPPGCWRLSLSPLDPLPSHFALGRVLCHARSYVSFIYLFSFWGCWHLDSGSYAC